MIQEQIPVKKLSSWNALYLEHSDGIVFMFEKPLFKPIVVAGAGFKTSLEQLNKRLDVTCLEPIKSFNDNVSKLSEFKLSMENPRIDFSDLVTEKYVSVDQLDDLIRKDMTQRVPPKQKAFGKQSNRKRKDINKQRRKNRKARKQRRRKK